MGAGKTARRFNPVPVQDCASVYHNMIHAFGRLVASLSLSCAVASDCREVAGARLPGIPYPLAVLPEFVTLELNGRIWEGNTLCLNRNTPCQGPRPPIAKILVDELFLGFAIQGDGNCTVDLRHSSILKIQIRNVKGMTPWRSLKRRSWFWTRA